MITSHLMGGLGNQLFQIFTIIAYGFTHSVKFVFPFAKSLPDGMERPTYWDSFLEPLKMFTSENTKHRITNSELYNFPLFREKGFNFQSIPKFSTDTMIYGYWQSYKYFDDVKDKIFQMIRLSQLQELVKTEYSRYFDDDYQCISMHFRLGDYKTKPEYHPILPYEYYQKSMQYILDKEKEKEKEKGKEKETRVLYFCEKEDNAIVLEHIQRLNQLYPRVLFVKVDDTIVDWKQMILMSCCRHNIIANSTFSWWGAYMNISESKLVCYPSIWFGERMISHESHHEYMKDLYPEKWMKIIL